jgi:hypothetical protein
MASENPGGRLQAVLYNCYHSWKRMTTYQVSGEWAGAVCDCGQAFGAGRGWHDLRESLRVRSVGDVEESL